MTISLQPPVLQWARSRAGFTDPEDLARKLHVDADKVLAWEKDGRITYPMLEKLARATHTPEGLLFLKQPPVERLPVTDFRTVGSVQTAAVSLELLDTVHDAQRKQAWLREYLAYHGAPPVDFVGMLDMSIPPAAAAERIRVRMGFDTARRAEATSWEQALTIQVSTIRAAGVLVLRSGIVGSGTHRTLSVPEFRGFALSDPHAPVIFLNGRDAPAAMMFTLFHELVHLWLGESGVSNLVQTYAEHGDTERYCNQVAAEILVPSAELLEKCAGLASPAAGLAKLTRHFRVSSLVLLRRLHDVGLLREREFKALYGEHENRYYAQKEASEGGGDFYRTQVSRVGESFIKAVLESAFEGRTPFRDACGLLGVVKADTLAKLAEKLEMGA